MTLDSVSHCGSHGSYKASRLVSGTHGTFWLIRGYKPKMVDDGGFSDLWQKWQPAVGSVDEQCVWDTAMTFEASLADRKFNPSWTDWRWLETSKSAIFSFGQHFQALKILKKPTWSGRLVSFPLFEDVSAQNTETYRNQFTHSYAK